jgi:hypothetical protein
MVGTSIKYSLMLCFVYSCSKRECAFVKSRFWMNKEMNFFRGVDRSELKKQMILVLSEESMYMRVCDPGISPLCPM